jgi:phosphoenolpyruvate carboxylase
LKSKENERLKDEWNLHRTLSKLNYQIHTDAIKEHIIPISITSEQTMQIYASEADVLNVALFGKTAKQWRIENPKIVGNIRDQATLEQLLVLANLESLNAEFIKMKLQQSHRLIKLNLTAITQLKAILGNILIKKLK